MWPNIAPLHPATICSLCCAQGLTRSLCLLMHTLPPLQCLPSPAHFTTPGESVPACQPDKIMPACQLSKSLLAPEPFALSPAFPPGSIAPLSSTLLLLDPEDSVSSPVPLLCSCWTAFLQVVLAITFSSLSLGYAWHCHAFCRFLRLCAS